MSGMIIPPASSLQGLQFANVAAGAEVEFKPDRPSVIYEVRLWSASTLVAGTVALTAQGIGIAGKASIPIPLLVTRAAVDVQSGVVGFLYIWRPSKPIVWSQEMPLRVQPSLACSVWVDGEPLPSAAAGARQ